MRHSLKIQLASFVAILFIGISGLQAQDVTTVEATSQEISNHLDLEAVASIFGDSKDLEDFENRLNDPETQISNLDLNNDNYVDYLRVVEIAEEDTHVIAIQAVLGDDIFQDVATIEVEKDNEGQTRVQVVGDVYMYGDNYIIEPVYVHRPIFFSNFWTPHYRPYYSSWYWGYYPRYYYHWSPYHVDYYHTHIYHHVNIHHSYHYTNVRRSRRAIHIHSTHRRNDYGRRHVERSYTSRRKAGHRATTRGTTRSRRDAAVTRGTTHAHKATKRAGRVDKTRRYVAPSTKIKKGRRISAANKARVTKNVTRKPMKVTTKRGDKSALRKGNSKATSSRQRANTNTRKFSTKKGNSVRKPASTNSRKVSTKRPANTRKATTRPTTSRKTYTKPRATKRSSSSTVSKRSSSRKSSTSSRPSTSRKSTSSRSTSSRSSKSKGSASRGSSRKSSGSRSTSSRGRKR